MEDKYKGFFAGLVSGVVKLLVGHPFDTIKVRVQVEPPTTFKGPLHCLLQTIRNEGLLALYKGASPPLIGWALMDSVHMGSLNYFRHVLGDSQNDITKNALAGLGSGLVVPFVATPFEVIKCRLQIQHSLGSTIYSGPIDCASKLVKRNGLHGLYKGFTGCLLSRSFFWSLWGSYELYNQILKDMNLFPGLIPFLSGGLAASTFWVISFPADSIKNRMMASSDPKFKSIASTAKWIWIHYKIKGFYRGFAPCMLRSFPTNGAAIFAFEFCIEGMKKEHEHDDDTHVQWGNSTSQTRSQAYMPAFSMPQGKTEREISLDQREKELAIREAQLKERERNTGTYNPPNFPSFRPIVYHDIEKDIPEQGRWLVSRFFLAWKIACLTYVLNVASAIALLAAQSEQSGANFGISLAFMLIGIPVAFVFWYRSIYAGVKHDRSISFMLFYFNYGVHLAAMTILGIGIPGWGGSGFIYMITSFGRNEIGAGVMCLLASVAFSLQVLYGIWNTRLVIIYYRSKGLTADQAKQQAIQGITSSSFGQNLAKEAIKTSIV